MACNQTCCEYLDGLTKTAPSSISLCLAGNITPSTSVAFLISSSIHVQLITLGTYQSVVIRGVASFQG